MTELFEAAAEAVDETVDELFPPRPGGLVDKHRRRMAEKKETEQETERIEQPAFRAVKVAPQSPEVFSAITYTIQAGGSAPVLPLGPYRYRSVIMVITSGANVVLAKDQGQAISSNGFALPYNIPLPLRTRAQVWAYNPGASTVQVSVIAEMYAPEKS